MTDYSQLAEQCVGKSFSKVKDLLQERNIDYRVTMEDGKFYIITDDMLFDRLNFSVENGIITKADLG
jgi:hypothetical protein